MLIVYLDIAHSLTQQEFKNCFDRWFDEIRNYISYRSFDPELATDITQEAFMKIWEKNIEYRGDQTKALIYKIAKELWISSYRKSKTEKNYQTILKLNTQYLTQDSMEYEDIQSRVEKAIDGLPEKRRIVFLLSRMEGLTYQQISEQLNISVKAIEKRMTLALQALRKSLNYET